MGGEGQVIPNPGDEIVVVRTGIMRRGRVCYADRLQILVKWNDGGSGSLTPGATPLTIITRPTAS